MIFEVRIKYCLDSHLRKREIALLEPINPTNKDKERST